MTIEQKLEKKINNIVQITRRISKRVKYYKSRRIRISERKYDSKRAILSNKKQ